MNVYTLPDNYQWLLHEPGPKMLIEALKLYGIREIVGKKHNAVILSWAKELSIEKLYTNDEIAWCSLAQAIIATRAGKKIPFSGYDILRAKSWLKWGVNVKRGDEMLGDTLVFGRSGGGHVGLYVGEDKDCFHVMGGNQGNQYNIIRLAKDRLEGARRMYSTIPVNIRKIHLTPFGVISINEK